MKVPWLAPPVRLVVIARPEPFGAKSVQGKVIGSDPSQPVRQVARAVKVLPTRRSSSSQVELGEMEVLRLRPKLWTVSASEVQSNVALLERGIPSGLWSDLRGEGLIRPDAPLPSETHHAA